MALVSANALVRERANERGPARRSALLAKGFRPFFLLAGVFAAGSLPLWLLALAGRADPSAYAGALYWHAHEMLLGFTVAVVAGFLLTAVGNWTARETATGPALLALVVLWLLGRAAMLGPAFLPRPLVAILDACFLPALAVALGRPILATKNRRNYPVLALVVLLGAANVFFHMLILGVVPGVPLRVFLAAVDLVTLLVVIITGRVIPVFTRNATRHQEIRSLPVLDRVAMGSLVLAAGADAIDAPAPLRAFLLGIAGLSTALRTLHWGAGLSLRTPLLWVLHVGHAWVAVGLFLRAGAFVLPELNPLPALHALTVGAFGTLTLGMMARVALGHTGRLLEAPRSATAAFVLVTLSAVTRVGWPLVSPLTAPLGMTVSGLLWSAAFALFVAGYARILVSPRVDGKPG